MQGHSEIARLRENIAASYMAAQWGLSGLASGTSKHRFITARMERMQEGHKELQTLMGDEAIAVVAETLVGLPTQPTRYYVLQVLRHELGNTEETEHLLDCIREAWETMDILIERFGGETAQKILTASSSLDAIVPSLTG
jgi:hypothetical protein